MIKLNDPRITAYLLGELDPAEVEVIEQALRSSPMRRGIGKRNIVSGV